MSCIVRNFDCQPTNPNILLLHCTVQNCKDFDFFFIFKSTSVVFFSGEILFLLTVQFKKVSAQGPTSAKAAD